MICLGIRSPTVVVEMTWDRFHKLERKGTVLSLYSGDRPAQGFALPMALGLGMVMLALGSASVIVAQSDRDSAALRQTSGASVLVSDSAIARAMVQLSQPQNGVLLVRNYDPINPATGTTYLGADGITKSGDETGTAINEWTGYNPSGEPCFQQLGRTAPNMPLTGSMGSGGTYTIRAYRYSEQKREGTVLIEGTFQGQSTYVAATLSIEPYLDDFPGIALRQPSPSPTVGVLGLRGRSILGDKGNVYIIPSSSANPSLIGQSARGDVDRSSYLNAVWSSPADGATADTVSGKIFACDLKINIPPGATGTNLGTITTSMTFNGAGGSAPTLYRVASINLSGTETIRIDTTGGPVQIELINPGTGGITLTDTAKILNVRTDGQPPQVGDARIIIRGDQPVNLRDRTCMQDVFLYSAQDEIRLFTTGAGCPSGQNTNFEGIAWVEAVLSSKNNSSNRNINYLGFANGPADTTTIPGATSGIAVPDDVTSAIDLLKYTKWPAQYTYGGIKNWQRVRL